MSCVCVMSGSVSVSVHLRFRLFTNIIVTFSGYMHIYSFEFIMYTYTAA